MQRLLQRHNRLILAVSCWGLLSLATACQPKLSAPATQQEVAPGWLLETPDPSITSLYDVVTLNAELAYAVGTGGAILMWDGTSWEREEVPVTAALRGVAGRFREERGELVMVVGDGGTILVKSTDAPSWTVIDGGVDVTLFGVWIRGYDDAFIVGDNGTILRWDGTTATEMVAESLQTRQITDENGNQVDEQYRISEPLKSVTGTGPANVIAVGPRGSAFHFDGEAWRREDTGTNRPLADVFAGGGIWATTTDGVLLRRNDVDNWDDSRRAPEPLFLQAVWASRGNDVFTVGMAGAIFHLGGDGWETTAFDSDFHLRGIHGFVTQEPTDALELKRTVFAVGAGGRILQGPQALPTDAGPLN